MDQKSKDSLFAKILSTHDQYKEQAYQEFKTVLDNSDKTTRDAKILHLITTITETSKSEDSSISMMASLSLVSLVDNIERYIMEKNTETQIFKDFFKQNDKNDQKE